MSFTSYTFPITPISSPICLPSLVFFFFSLHSRIHLLHLVVFMSSLHWFLFPFSLSYLTLLFPYIFVYLPKYLSVIFSLLSWIGSPSEYFLVAHNYHIAFYSLLLILFRARLSPYLMSPSVIAFLLRFLSLCNLCIAFCSLPPTLVLTLTCLDFFGLSTFLCVRPSLFITLHCFLFTSYIFAFPHVHSLSTSVLFSKFSS